MEMVPVSSTAIRSIGFENGTLAVEFTSGQTHHYDGVPETVYTELLNAPSPGKHFHQHIRSQYPATKQGEQS